MTVNAIRKDEALCEWFDGATPHEKYFRLTSLRAYSEDEDGPPEMMIG
jgi:uncharacterized protein YodC (DUF2158 family)